MHGMSVIAEYNETFLISLDVLQVFDALKPVSMTFANLGYTAEYLPYVNLGLLSSVFVFYSGKMYGDIVYGDYVAQLFV